MRVFRCCSKAGFPSSRWRMFVRRKSLSLPNAIASSRACRTLTIIAYVPRDQTLRSETVTRICSFTSTRFRIIIISWRNWVDTIGGAAFALQWRAANVNYDVRVQRDISAAEKRQNAIIFGGRDIYVRKPRPCYHIPSVLNRYVLWAHTLNGRWSTTANALNQDASGHEIVRLCHSSYTSQDIVSVFFYYLSLN